MYAGQLQKLAEAIREKCSRQAVVYLLHDNALAHIVRQTQEKLVALGWDNVLNPPHLPDISLSEYHLFRPLKQYLTDKSIAKFEDLGTAIKNFFELEPQDFWTKGINDLPSRWAAVVDNYGEHISD